MRQDTEKRRGTKAEPKDWPRSTSAELSSSTTTLNCALLLVTARASQLGSPSSKYGSSRREILRTDRFS